MGFIGGVIEAVDQEHYDKNQSEKSLAVEKKVSHASAGPDHYPANGDIRSIIVPKNFTYIGGGVGGDVKIILIKNFTVIEKQ